MRSWSRREVLKGGLTAGACALGADLVQALEPLAGESSLPLTNFTPSPLAAANGRERLLLDFGWHFHLGHASNPDQDFGFGRGNTYAKQGSGFEVAKPDFNVSGWRLLDLPHDWAIELPFVEDKELTASGSKPLGRAYPATSIGWYRKVFNLPAADKGRRVSIEFDGIFRDSIAILNGHYLGRNFSGYAPARYDVTDVANYGGDNVLVVRADATLREGWFYEGAGIYRHVWLVKTAPLHVAHWGTFVTTPEVSSSSALVNILTEVSNDGRNTESCQVVSTIQDAAGATLGRTQSPLSVAPGQTGRVEHSIRLNQPKLWSPTAPNLYTLVTTVEAAGVVTDQYQTPFGVRTVQFDANRGFMLNGERLELKGTCNHHDHAGVGAALPDRLQYYRIERLKELGSNAYRASHNPPTPELLNACDRLGMLMLDENRFFSSGEEGVSELERLIRRDRNHPSVIAWSLGNEEFGLEWNETGGRIAVSLRDHAKRLDPTRAVTIAMSGSWGSPMTQAIDVMGMNYEEAEKPGRNIEVFRSKFPNLPAMGTETGSTLCTRGEYANTPVYQAAYDVNAPYWGSTAEEWYTRFAQLGFLGGGFVWTGFDYRGEPTPFDWPNISTQFGILDTCGFPKDNFWYYKAQWVSEPVLHLFPHWNWPGREGQPIEVWCHSNLDRIELFLNGRSLGVQSVPKHGHARWSVPYAPGAIEARGFRDDGTRSRRPVLTARRETTLAPAAITLRADRTRIAADGEDVAVIEAAVVDARGRVVPIANHEIRFDVTGVGKLMGVGNGDPASHESDLGPARRAFNGLCAAIVRASKRPGEIQAAASARGLTGANLVITCTPTEPRPVG